MSNLRSAVITFTSTAILLLAGMVCLVSYKLTWSAVRTIGNAHYQWTFYAGRAVLIRNAQWWRVEPFFWDVDWSCGGSPVDWPGFFEDTHRSALGFELASGDYLTAFARVREDTEFIPPFKPVAPGTMLMVTTKFQLVVVPLWSLMLVMAIAPALQLGKWVGRRRGN